MFGSKKYGTGAAITSLEAICMTKYLKRNGVTKHGLVAEYCSKWQQQCSNFGLFRTNFTDWENLHFRGWNFGEWLNLVHFLDLPSPLTSYKTTVYIVQSADEPGNIQTSPPLWKFIHLMISLQFSVCHPSGNSKLFWGGSNEWLFSGTAN